MRNFEFNIPNSLVSIGDYAFSQRKTYGYSYNYSVPSNYLLDIDVNISDDFYENSKLESIGEYAFSICDLKGFIFPHSITSIGTNSFDYIESMPDIFIPENVNYIGENVFNLEFVESIRVDENNAIYDSRNNSNSINKTSTNTILYGCKNTIFPDSITIIGKNAFRNCSGLDNIEISDNIVTIEEGAFIDCSGLESIELNSNITSLGLNVFNGCINLKFAIMNCQIDMLPSGTFSNCSSLEWIDFGEYITEIYNFAYYDSDYGPLDYIILNENVNYVEERSFEDFPLLSSIYFKGTPEQFNDISIDDYQNYSFINSDVYFYNDCIHEEKSFYWHYVDNQINRDMTITSWRLVEESTCSSNGLEATNCTNCGIEITRDLALEPHNLENGHCTECSFKESSYVIVNDKFYPFTIEKDNEILSISSNNDEDGDFESTLSIYFENDSLVSFVYSIVESSSIYFTVTHNGKVVIYEEDITEETLFEIDVKAGDYLDFIYKIDTSNDEQDKFLHINNLHIYEWTYVLEPTCSTLGTKEIYCTVCDELITRYLTRLPHSYNSSDICTVCGEDKPLYDLYNDVLYPFDVTINEDDSISLTSTNHNNESYSSFNIKAYEDILVSFKFDVSSEHYVGEYEDAIDYFIIKINGEEIDDFSGNKCNRSYSISVRAGDVLSLVYEKDESGSEYNDNFTVYDLVINKWETSFAPTCTEYGVAAAYDTTIQSDITRLINKIPHTYENGVCSVCGEEDLNYYPTNDVYYPFKEEIDEDNKLTLIATNYEDETRSIYSAKFDKDSLVSFRFDLLSNNDYFYILINNEYIYEYSDRMFMESVEFDVKANDVLTFIFRKNSDSSYLEDYILKVYDFYVSEWDVIKKPSCSEYGIRIAYSTIKDCEVESYITRLPHLYDDNDICTICDSPRPNLVAENDSCYLFEEKITDNQFSIKSTNYLNLSSSSYSITFDKSYLVSILFTFDPIYYNDYVYFYKNGNLLENFSGDYDREVYVIEVETGDVLTFTYSRSDYSYSYSDYRDIDCLLIHDIQLSEWELIDEPTCFDNGRIVAYSGIDNSSVTKLINKVPHNYEDGYCTKCGNEMGDFGLINDSTYSFEEQIDENGRMELISTNFDDDSYSEYKIKFAVSALCFLWVSK